LYISYRLFIFTPYINFIQNDMYKIAIIGLGYVGLPLAVEFGKKYHTWGFDIDMKRIEELKSGLDRTKESDEEAIKDASFLRLTSNPEEIKSATTFIITVPTPIDSFKKPDLKPLLSASEIVGKILKKGDVVVYESTVYPGCTEEDCVPVLEQMSGLKLNADFFCGYSPERINPGDKINTLTSIMKVTSGSTPEAADFVDALYRSIIHAGTHKASCIKVAEASKAIENAQRDLNISFMNELALIFDRIGIDTTEVLEAAATKWNFLHFKPGLVGGHCISVDPYYLTHKAENLGYYPQVILSGRRVNDSMASFIAEKIVKLMIHRDMKIKSAKVLLLGISFKENCPDIRNSKVVDLYKSLSGFEMDVDVFDPWVDRKLINEEYGVNLLEKMDERTDYQVIILAVAHDEFKSIPFEKYKQNNTIIFDAKAFLPQGLADARL